MTVIFWFFLDFFPRTLLRVMIKVTKITYDTKIIPKVQVHEQCKHSYNLYILAGPGDVGKEMMW